MFKEVRGTAALAAAQAQEKCEAAGTAVARFVSDNRSTMETVGGATLYVGGCVVLAKASTVAGVAIGAAAALAGGYYFARGFYHGLLGETKS